MRGRHPKPAGLKDAQGNPGKRELPAALQAPAANEAVVLPFAKLSADGMLAYKIVGDDLRRLNFVRSSDEPLLLRYCDALARFWRVTRELDELGGETYECETSSGGKMLRMRPQFMVQERLAKRLESMEDRLGLSPMARQQYMLRMAAAGSQPSFLPSKKESEREDAESKLPPAARPSSPVGLLKNVH